VPANLDANSGAAASAAFADLEQRTGAFGDPTLLLTALTHPSYANEHPEDPTGHNERLEFLGDAVLGMIVARTLYQRFPDVAEGRLTEWRAYLVCGPTLSRIALALDLGTYLRLGRGEDQTGGREREGNLERAYEAVVGAIYLDRGLVDARAFVLDTLGDELATLETSPDALNPKGALQELVQQLHPEDEGTARPEYVLVNETGPDHQRHYEVAVEVDGQVLGQGAGGSKQQAEKEAAAQALTALRARLDEPDDGESQSRGAARGDS
jgi:ribonuclease-3